jgi:AbrB family looped-hinge helix DNA binding protein
MEASMGIFDAKTSTKGQVTVPAEVRKLLGLEPGGKLQFRTTEEGKVEIVAKKRGIAHLKGIFARPSEPIDIDAEIAAEVWERNYPPHPRSR